MGPADHLIPPGPGAPVSDETTILDLAVEGVLPGGLTGTFLRIGPNPVGARAEGDRAPVDAMVHGVRLHRGRAVAYRNRWVLTEATAATLGVEPTPGPAPAAADEAACDIVAFGGSFLALGRGSLAYEMTIDLGTRRRVDLAGEGRGLAPRTQLEPRTGALHLLAAPASRAPAHVTVSRDALTRTDRTIRDPPGPVTGLAVTTHHVLLSAEGFVGTAPRAGEVDADWVGTGTGAPRLVNAHDDADDADAVVAIVLTPALERWTVRPGDGLLRREVLAPGPQDFAACDDAQLGAALEHLWTVAERRVHRHALGTGRRQTHGFAPGHRPGAFVHVADPDRAHGDRGWLLGFVHHDTGRATDLVVLDASDIARRPVATVRIPRRVPDGHHARWIPSIR